MTIEKQIEDKKKELELLELTKREAELKIEIEKIKKTTIEETTIIRKTVYKDDISPRWNTFPSPIPCMPGMLPGYVCQALQTSAGKTSNESITSIN